MEVYEIIISVKQYQSVVDQFPRKFVDGQLWQLSFSQKCEFVAKQNAHAPEERRSQSFKLIISWSCPQIWVY